MSFGTGIELITGPSSGLLMARPALGLLALSSLLLSAAEPVWIAIASGALGTAYLYDSQRPGSRRPSGRLMLRADGSAAIRSAGRVVHARQCGGSWTSRLCSVIVLREILSGRRVRCLVCRSTNGEDEYRRLLVWLRTANSQGWDHPEHWA